MPVCVLLGKWDPKMFMLRKYYSAERLHEDIVRGRSVGSMSASEASDLMYNN